MLKRGGQFPFFIVVISLCLAAGCQHQRRADLHPLQSVNRFCNQIDSRIDFQNQIDTLNRIAQAYYDGCYDQVLRYGARAQTEYRQKTFSILKETSNIFLPDGTLIDYVLESYERAFLSYLIASSYFHLGQPDESKVELRRLDHELMTRLYNFGEDPVNILLQAVLWERLGEVGESRVDWTRLQEQEGIDASLRAFAARRTEAIDRKETLRSAWKVYALDSFPAVEWEVKWVNSTGGYFSITPSRNFLEACASDTGLRLSTESWLRKIAARYRDDYHPLLNLESWIRFPVGLAYGVTTFAFGTGIAVGGCALDAGLKGKGDLCRGSIEGGIGLMTKSPEVVRKTLEPDLRHWENVPAALLVTTAEEATAERCFPYLSEGRARRIL